MCRISASLAVQVVSVMLVHLAQIVIPVILAAVDAREEDLQAQHARLNLRMCDKSGPIRVHRKRGAGCP